MRAAVYSSLRRRHDFSRAYYQLSVFNIFFSLIADYALLLGRHYFRRSISRGAPISVRACYRYGREFIWVRCFDQISEIRADERRPSPPAPISLHGPAHAEPALLTGQHYIALAPARY